MRGIGALLTSVALLFGGAAPGGQAEAPPLPGGSAPVQIVVGGIAIGQDDVPVAAAKAPVLDSEIELFGRVTGSGGQAEIDRCDGGLVYDEGVAPYVGNPYYIIHNHCGGKPILDLAAGDYVRIAEVGVYRVVELQDVDKVATVDDIYVTGDLYLQTCHTTGPLMRIVALQAA